MEVGADDGFEHVVGVVPFGMLGVVAAEVGQVVGEGALGDGAGGNGASGADGDRELGHGLQRDDVGVGRVSGFAQDLDGASGVIRAVVEVVLARLDLPVLLHVAEVDHEALAAGPVDVEAAGGVFEQNGERPHVVDDVGGGVGGADAELDAGVVQSRQNIFLDESLNVHDAVVGAGAIEWHGFLLLLKAAVESEGTVELTLNYIIYLSKSQ